MRTFILAISFIFICAMMVGCSGTDMEPANSSQVRNPIESPTMQEEIPPTEENTDGETGSSPLLFDPANFDRLSEWEGMVIAPTFETVDTEQFLAMVANPIAYAPMAAINKVGTLLIPDPVRLVPVGLDKVSEGEWDFGKLEAGYFRMPEFYGDELGFYDVYDVVPSHYSSTRTHQTASRSVTIDELNRRITFLMVDYGSDTLTIKEAIQFKEEVSLEGLKVVGGYILDQDLHIVFAQGEWVYTVKPESLELVNTAWFEGWDSLRGYKQYRQDEMVFFVYQVDDEGSAIRKINLLSEEVVYAYGKEFFQIEGDILDVAPDVNILFILTVHHDRYRIYKTNEKTLHFVEVKDQFDDGAPFAQLVGLDIYSAGRYTDLVVFQKGGKSPVKRISRSADDWEEIYWQDP